MYLDHLECTECGERHDKNRLQTVCVTCGAPLACRYDLPRAGASLTRQELARRPRGLWRYRELLPLPAGESEVTLGEGSTPLLQLPQLGRELALDQLVAKDEGLNPTGSFKARGMSVAVTMARSLGARALAAPSAGNAGGALAAYGARAAMPVQLAMPADVPIANLIEARVCGAQVELIEGTIADCGRWIAERASAEGWFDVSTLKEPYRVEGKKTMGCELVEQLGWQLPDFILYPTGGGTGLVGMSKAFDELRVLGWLPDDRKGPRLVAVQAQGCAPIVDAYARGATRATPPKQPVTRASGLRVPSPIGDRWMLRVLRECNGLAVSIGEDDLIEGTRLLARCEGIFAAPEAGALVAAAAKLTSEGVIGRGARVVLLLTGTGLKYLECFEERGPVVRDS